MLFPTPLLKGHLRRRYKRFLADVEIETGEGLEMITAHCPNSGALYGGTIPGLPVLLSHNPSPTRKLAYTWEMVQLDGEWVGVNTHRPNLLVAEALAAEAIPELRGYTMQRAEVMVAPGTRLDFVLTGHPHDPRPCYVEVKNVHMMRTPALSEFPDSITTRGQKHLETLTTAAREGYRAVILYVVQRADATHFKIAEDIDPAYANLFDKAKAGGVEIMCYGCALSPEGIVISRALSLV